MIGWSAGPRSGALLLCAVMLFAQAAAGAEEPPESTAATVEVTASTVVPMTDPTADPTTDPAPPAPTTDPTTDPTTPPPTTDPTTDPVLPPPTTDPVPPPPTTDPVTPTPTTDPSASPSPSVSPTPSTSPTAPLPTPTLGSMTLEPMAYPTASTSITPSSRTSVTTSTTKSGAISTGGAEMMAALIAINTAEVKCEAAATGTQAVTIDSAAMPTSVGAFHEDQIVNAAIVMSAGLELGIPQEAQVIAVMTAMGESGLRIVDKGESIGPDNAGLFQHGAGGSWGTHAERVDPASAARSFYARLLAVPGWDTMEPAAAADAVQRAADPTVYAEFQDAAVEVVTALSNGAVEPSTRPCVTEFGTLSTGSTAWVSPVIGRSTSSFGYRIHPVLGIAAVHTGTDVAAKCGTPVRAASDGIVVWSGGGIQGRTGNQVVVYHGDGQITRYGHLLSGTVLVSVGDAVTAGQQIAGVGGDRRLDPAGAGNSTGCHLHFETNRDNGGTALDPITFLKERGVTLGAS